MSQLKGRGLELMINGSRTRGSISFHMAVLQPIVSTGTGDRERLSLTALYVSYQSAGARRGLSRACLIALSLFGDATDSEDGACVPVGGRLVALPFPSPCTLAFWQQVQGALYHPHVTTTRRHLQLAAPSTSRLRSSTPRRWSCGGGRRPRWGRYRVSRRGPQG